MFNLKKSVYFLNVTPHINEISRKKYQFKKKNQSIMLNSVHYDISKASFSPISLLITVDSLLTIIQATSR